MDVSNSSDGRHSADQLDLYDEGLRVLFPEAPQRGGKSNLQNASRRCQSGSEGRKTHTGLLSVLV